MKKLLSVTLFSGLLTLLRMASGFLIAKVVAIYTGPSGMAMLGQVQSIVGVLTGLASAPVGNAVVRYTAENSERGFDACAPWWKASIKWSIGMLLIVVPFSCIFSTGLSNWLFGNELYAWLIVLVALTLPLSVFNSLITSVTNGQQQYRRFVILGMISVLVVTIVMVSLILVENIKGALIAAAISSSIPGVVMLISSVKQPWFRLQYWWGSVEKKQIKGIGSYVAMAITTALTAPVSLLLVRNILISNVGWEQAGHWQAVWKISEVYLGVITMALGTYYLPRLSSLKSTDLIFKEIKSTGKVIVPFVVILAATVYLLRDISITVLFTEKFRPARDLFFIQLCGDVLKILAWLYAFPLVSRGVIKWYMVIEVLFSTMFVLLAYIFVKQYGVQGANIAYMVNYLLCFIFISTNLKRFLPD